MKRLLFPLLLISATLLVVAGCSDDEDCASCPSVEQLNYLITGTVDLHDGELEAWMYIYSADGKLPDIDSVLVADEAAEVRTYYVEGGPHVYVDYDQETELASGDTAEINVFTPNGMGTCKVKLLDHKNDVPVILEWSTSGPYDTVATETDITVEWESVPLADWYILHTSYRYDSAGTYATASYDYVSTDTVVTIPGSAVAYDGALDLTITALTGPAPDEIGNFTGKGFSGVVICYSFTWFPIFIGTGDAYPEMPSAAASQNFEANLREILLQLQTDWLK